MKFDRDIYFGLLCGGKVRRAVAYLRQFPEKASLAQRLERRMTQPPRLRTRVAMAEPGSVVFCPVLPAVVLAGDDPPRGCVHPAGRVVPVAGGKRTGPAG